MPWTSARHDIEVTASAHSLRGALSRTSAKIGLSGRQRARTKPDDDVQPDTRQSQPSSNALVALAQRECRAGRLAEAAAAYRQILALRPDVAEGYKQLGNVLLIQGKLDEAAAQYERAAALKPEPLPGAQQPGQHPPDSRASSTRRLARYRASSSLSAPDFAEPHNNLGSILWTGQARSGRRLGSSKRSLSGRTCRDAQQPGLHPVGARKARSGRRLNIERAIALRPDYAEAHNNLGSIFRRRANSTKRRPNSSERWLSSRASTRHTTTWAPC